MSAAPFDAHEAHLRKQRAAAPTEADRKLLQRGITEVRKWQRRWRFELLLHDHTARGRNQGKLPQLTGVRLRGNSTTATRTASFDSHWESIHGDTAAAHINTYQNKLHRLELAAAHFPGESTVTHGGFLSLVQRLPKGTAGADDGVLGEHVQALHAEHLDTLFAATVRLLEGGEHNTRNLEFRLGHLHPEDRERPGGR